MSASPVIILDLDGTLLNTSFRHHALYSWVCSELGIESLPHEAYWKKRRSGLSNLDVITESTADEKLRQFAADAWLRRIESSCMLDHDRLFPFIKEWIKMNGEIFRFGLVTLRTSRNNLMEQLDKLCLRDLFTAIAAVPHQQKAHLAKAKAAVELFPSERALCWIGDSEVDMKAAAEIGVRAIGVSSGIRPPEVLLAHGATDVYDELSMLDLQEIILSPGVTNAP